MKKTNLLFLLCALSCHIQLTSQSYFGAGNDLGVIVTSSSEEGEAVAQNTMNGKGMDADLFEASRFLTQAGFSASRAEIEALAETLDFEGWINAQYALPMVTYYDKLDDIWDEIVALRVANGIPMEDINGPYIEVFNYTWSQKVITEEDQLRQKVANALSEIFVVSANAGGWARGMASYYDALYGNAFGNFEDVLLEVSLHPMMGNYLSHFDNPKADPVENIHPDENYAREIMQLFSIGLIELNLDGTAKLDANGDEISTYTNEDVKELAKVFTGLGAGGIEPWVDWTTEPSFGMGFYNASKTIPMVMYQDWHETSEKLILGSYTIPANQDGMTDVEEAVNFLFNHENVGPFLARGLIKRLIKSNPSNAYISRVATAFNDNGSGVRGDMQAVISAILLDEEARDCAPMLEDFSARLRVPITKFTQVARAIDLDSPEGRYWNEGYSFEYATWQLPMFSPDVFNFYSPDYSPIGLLADNGITAPEFEIHNTQIATSYINKVNDWTEYNYFMYSWEDGNPLVLLDRTFLESLADEPEQLLHELDVLFTHGQLTDETRGYIRTAIDGLAIDNLYERVNMALTLLLISADYNIMR